MVSINLSSYVIKLRSLDRLRTWLMNAEGLTLGVLEKVDDSGFIGFLTGAFGFSRRIEWVFWSVLTDIQYPGYICMNTSMGS